MKLFRRKEKKVEEVEKGKKEESPSKRGTIRLIIKKPRFLSKKKPKDRPLKRSNSLYIKLQNHKQKKENKKARKSKQVELLSEHEESKLLVEKEKEEIKVQKANPPHRAPVKKKQERVSIMREAPIINTAKSSQRAMTHYKRAAIAMLVIGVLFMAAGTILMLSAISLPAFATLTATIAATEVAKQICLGIGCALMPTGIALTIFSALSFNQYHKHTKNNKEVERSLLDSLRSHSRMGQH